MTKFIHFVSVKKMKIVKIKLNLIKNKIQLILKIFLNVVKIKIKFSIN